MVDLPYSLTTQPAVRLVVEEFSRVHDLVLIRCHSLVERIVLEVMRKPGNATHSHVQVRIWKCCWMAKVI